MRFYFEHHFKIDDSSDSSIIKIRKLWSNFIVQLFNVHIEISIALFDLNFYRRTLFFISDVVCPVFSCFWRNQNRVQMPVSIYRFIIESNDYYHYYYSYFLHSISLSLVVVAFHYPVSLSLSLYNDISLYLRGFFFRSVFGIEISYLYSMLRVILFFIINGMRISVCVCLLSVHFGSKNGVCEQFVIKHGLQFISIQRQLTFLPSFFCHRRMPLFHFHLCVFVIW